jgi:hypothetical protein
MCVPNRQLDPRTRRWMTLGNFSLVAGLLLWTFRSYIPAGPDWLHPVCGFLLGLSIGINLFRLRLARRCCITESRMETKG